MKQYVYHHVFIKCSAVRRPPSVVRRPSSAVRRPPSAVRRPPSVVRRPPSVVRRPSSAVRRPPSVVRRPPSVVRRPPSAVRSAFYLHPEIHIHVYTRFQNYATSLKNTLTSNVSFMSQKLLKIANVNKLSKDILNRI